MTYNPTNINVGSAPNDNTGDPARTAFQKVNTNFTAAATAINNVVNVSALTDVGPYAPTTDKALDWLVLSRNLTTTYRINVQELLAGNNIVSIFPVAGTYTYTVPTNATVVRMYCLGAGGGGGGGASGTAGASLTAGGGAGGGGGSYAESVFFVQIPPPTSPGNIYAYIGGNLNVVVGAGGAAGVGKAAGSVGAGGAGGNGGASYVSDIGTAPLGYYCYANGGLGGGGGGTGSTASTGGNGGSWLSTLGGSTAAGTFAAGVGDGAATLTNIVHEWCGGPGFGTSATNGSRTTGAITIRGGAGGAGGGSILNNVAKIPGNPGLTPINTFFVTSAAGFTNPGGGAASTTGAGANADNVNFYQNFSFNGWGGSGGGACGSAFKAGDGSIGGTGIVVIVATL